MSQLAASTLPLPCGTQATVLLADGAPLPGGLSVARGAREPAFGGGIAAVQGPFRNGRYAEARAFVNMRDSSGAWGVWRLTIETAATPPRVSEIVKVMRVGDALPDGTTVDALSHGDANQTGGWATVVRRADGSRRVATWTPAGGARVLPEAGLSDLHPVLTLHDTGEILLVARHGGRQRLLLLRGAEARPLLSAGDLLVDTTAIVASIGISHMSGPTFIVQGEARGSSAEPFAVEGRAGERPTLLAAPDALGVTRSRAGAPDFHPGSARTAPRLGPDGRRGLVVHASRQAAALYVGGFRVAAADGDGKGDPSPRGHAMAAILPPVMGFGGLFCYQAMTAAGMELVMSDGAAHRTILASGDTVGERRVKTLVAGLTPRQMLPDGSVLLVVEDADGAACLALVRPV